MDKEEIINFLNKGTNTNESMINTISNYPDKDIDKESLNDMMNICKKNIEIIQGIIDYIEEKDKSINDAINYIDNHMYENYCYAGSEYRLKEILERGKNGK